MAYQKPTAQEIRKVSNSFGSMPAKKMIDMRARTTKIVLMDYALYLINEEKMPAPQVKEMVSAPLNKAIESGLCTLKLKDTLFNFIDRKTQKADPLLRLHCAITAEALEAMAPGNGETSAFVEEIQDALECGDCMGDTRPSIESLNTGNVTDCQLKLYSRLGGTLASQVISALGDTLNTEYVKVR